MTNNFNSVTLAGRLTRDPEKRDTKNSSIVHFGLAINRVWYSDGEKHEEVCFVEVGFWGKRGDVVKKYFKKGDPILIQGYLKFSEFDDKDGNKRNRLAVVGERFEFLGSDKREAGSTDEVPF